MLDPARLGPARGALVRRLFPRGIPSLWCPSLTHFSGAQRLDEARGREHLRAMLPWVKGFLAPGSTGEGWEMSDAEVRALVAFLVEELNGTEAHLLVGVLKRTVPEMIEAIEATVAWLERRTGRAALDALAASPVCGFTVCPPAGAELTQAELTAALDEVLSLGYPMALYQLPQVTGNELSPASVASLAARHPNFFLFKDMSGADRVALAGVRDVFLVRGAEGGYAGHLAANGGAYDGFLLSTANCFGRQLAALAGAVERGERTAAEAFSRALSDLCAELFPIAGAIGAGNAFTNANKALDHFFAYGPGAAEVPPPRLRSGERLPRDLVIAAGAALERHRLAPARGYLAGA